MGRLAGQEDGQFTEISVLKGGGLSTAERMALPLIESSTVSVAAGATSTVTLTVPQGERWVLKSINHTAGGVADLSVTQVLVDGIDTKETASFETATKFGEKLVIGDKVEFVVTNSGLSALDFTGDVLGVRIS